MRSKQARNAARVFPDPVGASRRTLSPAAMRGHDRLWIFVGQPTTRLNQACTGPRKILVPVSLFFLGVPVFLFLFNSGLLSGEKYRLAG